MPAHSACLSHADFEPLSIVSRFMWTLLCRGISACWSRSVVTPCAAGQGHFSLPEVFLCVSQMLPFSDLSHHQWVPWWQNASDCLNHSGCVPVGSIHHFSLQRCLWARRINSLLFCFLPFVFYISLKEKHLVWGWMLANILEIKGLF